MKSYKAIKEFYDMQDNNHLYREGDTYPRDGADVSNERIKELSSGNNATKAPLIEEVRLRRMAYTDEINDED